MSGHPGTHNGRYGYRIPRSSVYVFRDAANGNENVDIDDMVAHKCPRCDGDLIRIRRRLVDRLISVFVPVRRFRCVYLGCFWEGNLRRTSDPPSSAPLTVW